jgi:hypothetical protein
MHYLLRSSPTPPAIYALLQLNLHGLPLPTQYLPAFKLLGPFEFASVPSKPGPQLSDPVLVLHSWQGAIRLLPHFALLAASNSREFGPRN